MLLLPSFHITLSPYWELEVCCKHVCWRILLEENPLEEHGGGMLEEDWEGQGLAEDQTLAADCVGSFAGRIWEPEATVLLVSESGNCVASFLCFRLRCSQVGEPGGAYCRLIPGITNGGRGYHLK